MAERDSGKRIDLNRASEDELRQIAGIDESRARRIVTYREEHGPFGSWEELEEIEGIGPALVRKARQRLDLGGAAGDGQAEAEEESGAEELAEAEEETAMDEQELEGIEILEALVRLDLEAALAYDAAADLAGDEETERQLRSFRDDHFRHIDDLNPFLVQEGGKPLDRNAPPPALLPWLARLAGPLGESTMVLTLVNNEQLTNLSYEAALAYDWDDEVEEVLDRNRADEERHLTWLSEQESRMEEQQEEASGEPEPPEAPGT